MISRKGFFAAMLLTSILLPWHAWGDTLLQIDEKGEVAPNLVKEWKVIDDAVLLKLGVDLDAKRVKTVIEQEIPGISLRVIKGGIAAYDVDWEILSRKLAAIEFRGASEDEVDSLAELDAMEEIVLALVVPDGSASIRAGRTAPSELLFGLSDNFQAKVIEAVDTERFPMVQLKLMILKPPTTDTLGEELAEGKVIDARPFYKLKKVGRHRNVVDFSDNNTVVNIGANYLKAGDIVLAQPMKKDEKGIWDLRIITRE